MAGLNPDIASLIRATLAAARHAVIFAYCLDGDLAAGVENALDDRCVDIRHIVFQKVGAEIHLTELVGWVEFFTRPNIRRHGAKALGLAKGSTQPTKDA
jgi:hypothetical protein